MRSRSRWNGVRKPQSGSTRWRRAGYERVARGESSRSSRSRMRQANAAATSPLGCSWVLTGPVSLTATILTPA